MLLNALQADWKCAQMTHDIRILKNFFPMHSELRNYYHKYPNALR